MFDIVVATRKFSFLAYIVDSNHNSSLGAFRAFWNDVKFLMDVHGTRAG
jgi:hypothetical protein